jgi:hypothetical protein
MFFYKAYLEAYRRRGESAPARVLAERRLEEAEQALAAARAQQPAPPPPRPIEPTPQPTAPAPPQLQPQAPVPSRPPEHAAAPAPPPRWMRPLGIGLVAAGVAGLGVGGAMAGLAHSASNDVQNASGEFDRALYDKQQRGVTYQNTAIALFAAGGALVVAGAVPLALSFRRSRSYAWTPVVAPDAIGLSYSGRF